MERGNLLSSLLILSTIVLLITPLISAQFGWGGGYYRSPLDYLDNEWVIFSLFFLVFFAIIFFTVNRAFHNPAVSGVIALGLSLMIALVMARRGLLYGFMGEEIGAWVLIITILIGLAFLIRFIYESFGKTGTMVGLIGLWFVIRIIDPYDLIPYQLLTDVFVNTYEFFASILGLIVLVIGGILILNLTDTKTFGERILKQLGKRRPH